MLSHDEGADVAPWARSSWDVVLLRVADGVKETPRLVQHERGVGKTALLEVLRDEARDRGCLVVMTSAARGEN